MTSLGPVLQRAAADHGERQAVRIDRLVQSYSSAQAGTSSLRGVLAQAGSDGRGDHPRRVHLHPREAEQVLYEHPAVPEVAVAGIPHDELGEEVRAAVTFQAGRDRYGRRTARICQGADGAPQISEVQLPEELR
jgi:hypothetical protein